MHPNVFRVFQTGNVIRLNLKQHHTILRVKLSIFQ